LVNNLSNVIEIKDLSKEYRLGTISTGMLTKDISSAWARFRGKEDPNSLVTMNSNSDAHNSPDRIWALKDINLEIKQGEILGIIGKNGAGKTTLLKILSRITSPTNGTISIKGRTASLIAVGTGFHPELTGRENIYLNGSILGLRKHEIDQRFDKIVDFSGVEKYIDTPVKRYSSGMYVRLGFSVAAHLEPDILIVDEVLAVGDAEFRQKALGKMQDASKEEGRTVLFVSHNMAAIRQLCNKCILLDKGSLKAIGQTEEIVKNYLGNIYESNRSDSNKAEYQYEKFDDEKDVELIKACVMDTTGLVRNHFSCDEPITIRFSYNVRKIIPDLYGYFQLSTIDEVVVMVSVSNDMEVDPINGLPLDLNYVDIVIPSRSLGHGRYYIHMGLAIHNSIDYILADSSTELSINLTDDSTIRGDKRHGFFSTICNWQVENGRDSIEINK